ncbi:HlyD family efflux transporter periplasmic adaptor subunit [Noviherbaspirillum cavernae]|uniref:HlyD family efflux transporter periplasmic adaptor subunit n=1 Tax=Noviherbaspirillum cavernae TaxID=2320862 RepID=A0A418WVM5_9BURK|nr:HlyD family efflux transporter periplasmic adaptor subunit [Noviherbaspirillum cavernae]RJF96745.1 HlyD family efflux transporter periplasmic adaptor subunit [Noviherbaspirillum cavernae]
MTAAGPLYSVNWHRVGSLHPRIQPGTRIRRQVLRGEEWFVFSHAVSGRHYRLNRKAYELVGRLDGEHSLDALWQGLQRKADDQVAEDAEADDPPTQDEIIVALAHLMDAGLVLFDTMPDWSKLQLQRQTQREAERRANLNPFAFSLKLFNPSALLDRLAFLQPLLWHPLTLVLWAVLIGWGVVHAAIEWNAIRHHAAVNLLTPRGLFLMWLVYPFLKALHELAHALAVRHWGGEVKEAGIAFFVLVPAPFVDASAATAFPGKWQRIAVSCAGIAVELSLAAVALLVWSAAENGVVRDAAFAVMAIGGVSTLAFNANPLMRFDGYYILCDLLELPNLASRSQRWWSLRLQRFLKQADDDADGHPVGSEGFWCMLYAPASWAYRLCISVVIVQWVVAKSVLLGFAATLWLLHALFVKPLSGAMRMLFAPAHPSATPWKPMMAAGGATAALVAAIAVVPVPASTVAVGVVWLPERSQIRTGSDGRVVEIVAHDGQRVTKGQPLAVIEEPPLLARRARLHAQRAGAEAEQASGWLKASVQGRNAHEEIERLRRDLAQLDEQIDKLTLRAGVDGVVVIPHADDLLGRHLLKGSLIGYVLAGDPTIVRAAIAQDDIGRFKGGVEKVSVQLAEAGNQTFEGRVLRVDPSSTVHLPSGALGDKGGGGIVTDPAEREGMTALEPFFLADVQLTDRKVVRAGGRAWVRFEHEAKPLSHTALWRFRQLFLKIFSMEGA